jgi:hypothetical protein
MSQWPPSAKVKREAMIKTPEPNISRVTERAKFATSYPRLSDIGAVVKTKGEPKRRRRSLR